METVNGCTIIASQDSIEPVHFGPAEMAGAYVAIVGVFPPGQPGPRLHLHPDTDEAFYIAEGDATFLLGDREVSVTKWRPPLRTAEYCAHCLELAIAPCARSSSSHRATPSIRSFPSTSSPTAGV